MPNSTRLAPPIRRLLLGGVFLLPFVFFALFYFYPLAAILRLAEFLERGRNANVDDIGAHWDDDTLYLTLFADEFPAVEIWEAERNAVDLMSKAFGRRVVVELSLIHISEPTRPY